MTPHQALNILHVLGVAVAVGLALWLLLQPGGLARVAVHGSAALLSAALAYWIGTLLDDC